MITNFAELLATAKAQPEPQRLLFLFAKAHEDDQPGSAEQTGGTITATMCVDKLPEELTTFDDFVAEADAISPDWDFIFIAGLAGSHGNPPTSEDASQYLDQMTHHLMSGEGIHQYMVFDRNDNTVEIQVR